MASPGAGIIYLSREGDRWDLLAWEYYGDPTAYSGIIFANPAVPVAPIIPTGSRILIPLITPAQTPNLNLPPWMRAT